MSSLRSAHKGYLYQDLATAFALAHLVVRGAGAVTVDRKEVADDKFDDLTVRAPGVRVSRQLKWTERDNRPLSLDDFTGTSSSVRIDKLVASYSQLQREPQTEVRLAVRWGHPSEPELLGVLAETPTVPPTFPGSDTRRYKLQVHAIWPVNSPPIWSFLANVSRQEFVAFADEFVVETGLPSFSSDLSRPGQVEQHLLDFLVHRVGIGQFPNRNRSPEDVAARLVHAAAAARADGATLSAEKIAGLIALQRDFGSIEQEFPFQSSFYQERSNLKETLLSAVRSNRVVALEGPPGSGKSWELTTLAERLREQGCLVARHYCYISPDDDLRQARITADTMFGNIIRDLLAADPSLIEAKTSHFAANISELQALLRAAASRDAESLLVVIVDGLDHIGRVAAEAPSVASGQLTIVEDLASLEWPPGTCLVAGSQPGQHLSALVSRTMPPRTIEMPPLSPEEMNAIAAKEGLDKAIATFGDSEADVSALLSERAGGNALCTVMLARGAVGAATRGVAPEDHLRSQPMLSGDLSRYYDHLYGILSPAGTQIADLLGVIDFAVTREELRHIVGPVAARSLRAALDELAPLIVEVAGSGGIRIFHESFRRHVLSREHEAARVVAELLNPVIDWLSALGFYTSSRAFRFLLPSLARARRHDEMFAALSPDFVGEAVAHCHPYREIERNLRFAAAVAAAQQSFPALIRIAHLIRALDTCFEEHLFDSEPYWLAHLAVHGAERTSERLAPDGEPVLDRHTGLRVCSQVAFAGGNPPWSTYLDLPPEQFEGRYAFEGWEALYGRIMAAFFHALASLGGIEEAREWIREKVEHGQLPRASMRYVAALWGRLDSDDAVSALKGELDPAMRAELALSVAEVNSDEEPVRFEYAAMAAHLAPTASVLSRCAARLGGDLRGAKTDLDLEDIDLANHRLDDESEVLSVRDWLLGTQVLAFTEPARLREIRTTLEQPGWYWSWLAFTTWVCDAEATMRRDPVAASELVIRGFELLSSDTNPFLGKPRACDLYGLRVLIRESIGRGLACLAPAHWGEGLKHLLAAAKGTMSYLQGSPSGPIRYEVLLELLEPHTARPEFRARIEETVVTTLSIASADGQYYGIQAELDLLAARICAKSEKPEIARKYWESAARRLTGYGHRKDITIFEFIESLPALAQNRDTFLDLVERLDGLIPAVLAHTDGKETKHAPNALLRVLTTADPACGLSVIIGNMLGPVDAIGWIDERAYRDVLASCAGQVSPLLQLLGETTIKSGGESDDPDFRWGERVPACLSSLGDLEASVGSDLAVLLVARLEGDFDGDAEVPNRLTTELSRLEVFLPRALGVERVDSDPVGPVASTRRLPRETDGEPEEPPPVAASLPDFMGWVRRAFENPRSSRDQITNQIGYRCVALWEYGLEEEAHRVVDFVHRVLRDHVLEQGPVFEALAKGLRRHGLARLAARAFVLAFCGSRGGRGWHSIGDGEHAYLLDDAEELDREEARIALGEEVARKATERYSSGLTRAVVDRVAQWDIDSAVDAWTQGLSVLEGRLGTAHGRKGFFPRFDQQAVLTWDIEQALAAVLAARCSHPEADRRGSALLAFAHLVKLRPVAAGFALETVLWKGASPSSSVELLQVVWEAEGEPFQVTRRARASLEQGCRDDRFGARLLCGWLLERAGAAPPVVAAPPPPVTICAGRSRPSAVPWHRIGVGVLDGLDELWARCSDVATERFFALKNDQSFPNRRQDRIKFAGNYGVSFERWIPLVHDEDERFACALHEAANGIVPHRIECGSYDTALESEIGAIVLPDIYVQLGVVASRMTRPGIPTPSETRSGFCELDVLGSDDAFSGWYRIAVYEREFVSPNGGARREPKSEVVHMAGLRTVMPGEGSPGDPLVPLHSSTWRSGAARPPIPTIGGFRAGPVVGIIQENRPPCMEQAALMLPQELAQRLGLHSGPFPGPLLWTNEQGQSVVRLRVWEVDGLQNGERPSRLSGCDLVVRHDFFERIATLAACPLVFHHLVHQIAVCP